jgi:hypothetical protein
MELLYLSDINQLQDVLVNNPDLIKCARPITGDMSVAFELERLGINYIDVDDFITPDDSERNHDIAYILAESSWNACNADYEGFRLTNAVRNELLLPFIICLNARIIFGKLFDTFLVDKISGYFPPPEGLSRNWPMRGMASVFEAVLYYISEERSIPIENLNSALNLSSGKDLAMQSTFNSREDFKEDSKIHDTDKIVLIYEQYMPASEHTKLVKLINDIPGVRAVSITTVIFDMASKFRKQHGVTEYFANTFSLSMNESIVKYQGDYPEIFANRHLSFQFERIKQEIETALEYGNLFESMLAVLKPSLVIFAADAFVVERTLVRLAQKKNIPTVGLLHGGSGFKLSFKYITGDADYIFVWNELQRASLVEAGVDGSRLKSLGCLRYEDAYFKYCNNRKKNSLVTKNLSKVRLGLIPDKPLIVFLSTAFNDGPGNSLANPRMHRFALREFLSLVKSRSDLQFMIKTHPSYDYYQIYLQMCDESLPNLVINQEANLSEILNATDICFTFNYSTTAALEAMLNFVPVVFFDNATYPVDTYQDHLSSSGVCRVSTMKELEYEIDCLLTNATKRMESHNQAAKTLKLFFGEEGVSASDRVQLVIDQLLSSQNDSNLRGLVNATTLHVFLYSNEEEVKLIRNELVMTSSPADLMVSLVYLAGTYTLGTYCIFRIFEICSLTKNNNSQAWNDVRWDLLQVYITACFNNPKRGPGVLKRIEFILHYVIHPHRYYSASTTFKRMVAKYLLQQIFGRKAKIIYRFIYSMVKSI